MIIVINFSIVSNVGSNVYQLCNHEFTQETLNGTNRSIERV